MTLTGAIVIYIIIWWIVFFSSLPIGITQNDKKFEENIKGIDPGSPKNPNIGKKFFYSTLITTIIFIIIHYMVKEQYLNIRELLD
ncbi:MAG: hypothetical protein CL687_04455 [Candidatus Pelagibacter sp.]|nr:hypothetical protein [Candidatus Pelagibacter sp.]OUW23492.1 MAG: hypothetical protein CBD34_02850 [Rickettsiales bacterium TMED174]|tara:strand:+ start:2652 stop:2906 length:255 start_codon:yes stop_codon:yes gene_type:complete